MASKHKKRGLGKSLSDLGLAALLGSEWKSSKNNLEKEAETSPATDTTMENPQQEINQTSENSFYSEGIEPPEKTINPESFALKKVSLEQLQPGRYQPRRHMDEANLQELANSIQQQGVIQPIVVRQIKDSANNQAKYEIVAGERRYRAAIIAAVETVPVVIQELNDHDTLAIALIENLQREDLNAMDQAISLQRMLSEFDLTHLEIATAVGKSRATISNLLRLLNLHPEVQKLVQQGDLEMGHGRALLSVESEKQSEIAEYIISRSLTVRQTEKMLSQRNKTAPANQNKLQEAEQYHLDTMQKNVANNLGCKTIIKQKNNAKGSGKIILHYKDKSQLEKITDLLVK